MAKLTMFNLITLDGYFKGINNDISWHNFGEDEQEMFAIFNEAQNDYVLVIEANLPF